MRLSFLSIASTLVAVVVLSGSTCLAETAPPAIRTPEAAPPAIFDRLGSLDGLLAFGIRADGRAAVIALPSARDGRTIVRLMDLDSATEIREMEMNGVIRSLIFGVDGRELFGILYRPLKKRAGDAYLIRIDLATWKMERGNRLPSTARSIDHWLAKDALLIASKDEIRTVYVNGLRTGPLYRVTGRNLSVSSVTGDSLILVGQDDGLALVDLEDRPGPEEMPVREHINCPAAVVGLAIASDASHALAQLTDGRMLTVTFAPLAWTESGTTLAVVSPTRRQLAEEPAGIAPPPPPPVVPGAAVAGAGVAGVEPNAVEPASVEPSAVAEATPPPPPPAPETPPAPAPKEQPQPEPVATPSDGTSISGSIGGDRSVVAAVILLGPNNMIREAARIVPEDGRWVAQDLQPGRYRIQLDGGSGRVLVTVPPYLLIDVSENEAATAPEIRVVRSVEPADRR